MCIRDRSTWDENCQIITDYLMTKDGRIPEKLPEQFPDEHVPVYCVNNDLLYTDDFSLPRFAYGAFNECLKHLYWKVFGKELKIEMFGKPAKVAFEYAEKFARDKLKNEGNQVGNFYMIGDNPASDIEGGKRMGWKTVLINRTGVVQRKGQVNDAEADFVVKDFYDAIRLIFHEEGPKFDEQVNCVIHFLRNVHNVCLLYTSPSPRDGLLSRMPSSA
eukprot:TRINITY_DN6674_c0_g1_i2.p2 TRINITY_DN6674_c0_g1~~TRINITY_DN6674_c0_g1_i2.p2  ORF type:complete len:217 (-),score=44.55 TRINITY_DN6674_c0_g1_i2:11-661(-)